MDHSLQSRKRQVDIILDFQREVFRIADDLAVHYFGNKCEYIYESEIDRELYEKELAAAKESFGQALSGKPEDLQKKMIRGKMMKFLQEKAMECQRVGFEESDLTIAEYLAASEKRVGQIKITKAEKFGL